MPEEGEAAGALGGALLTGAWASLGGSVFGMIGAALTIAAAAYGLYDALGPGRRHRKRLEKLMKKIEDALEVQAAALSDLEANRDAAFDRFVAAAEESATAQRAEFHLLAA